VLLAYAKLDLDGEILASSLPDDPFFASLLAGYFPPGAVNAFPQEPERHRLKREIISTVLTNAIVNLAGPVFVLRTREVTGLSPADAARAFVLSDGAFGLSALKARIDALDLKIPASLQTQLYSDIADQFRRASRWFLTHVPANAVLADTAARYRAGIEALRQSYVLDPEAQDRVTTLAVSGMPEDLARDLVLLAPLSTGLDVVVLAQDSGSDVGKAGALYFAIGGELGLDRLRSLVERFHPPEHWDRLALRRLMGDLSSAQRGITGALLKNGKSVEQWSADNADALARTREFLAAMESSGDLSVAKLMLASSQIQNLA
jgi:glutamate dehydrogenase